MTTVLVYAGNQVWGVLIRPTPDEITKAVKKCQLAIKAAQLEGGPIVGVRTQKMPSIQTDFERSQGYKANNSRFS